MNRMVAGALAALFSFASAIAAPVQRGIASWYGRESGSRTANGEPFPTADATAAHRTLPFGTRVRVTDQRTGRTGRLIDLSPAAAGPLGLLAAGTARVCLVLR